MELHENILPRPQVDLELARLVQRRIEQRHQLLVGDVRPALLRVPAVLRQDGPVVVAVQ